MPANPQQHLRDHIQQLMPTWHAADLQEIEYLPGGYSNENYVFTYNDARFVLRIPKAIQPFVDRQHEHAWYTSLPSGIGVQPLAFDTATGHMLTPWIDGVLLVDAWPDLTLKDLTAYLHTLHRRLPPNTRDYDLTTINRSYWQHQSPPHSPVTPPPHHMQICHNDLNPWNILVTDSGWITLDWEFAGNNDPLFDLVSLHQGLELPPGELLAFAEAYLGADELSRSDLAARLLAARHAFWVREHGWAHYQLGIGNEREEIRGQLITAERELKDLESY